MTVPQSREGTRRAADKTEEISYKDGVSSRPVTNHPYSELPGPTTTSSETNTGTATQASTEASSNNQGSSIMASTKDHRHMPKGNMNTANSLVGISSLKEGAYSEAESHNGFLEALNAWRVAGNKDESGATASAKSSKKVKFTDVQAAWDH
jgi:hypothetical protein